MQFEPRQSGLKDDEGLPAFFAPLAGFLVLIVVLPIWLCPYFPSHNAPALLSVADIVAHYDSPDYGYSSYYDLHYFPVPYWFQFVLTIPLLAVTTPVITLRLLVTFLLLLRFGAIYFLLRQIEPRRALYALVTLAFAYEFILMRGYFNFHAGISLGLIVFGWHLRYRDRWTIRAIVIWNGMIVLLFFCHPIPLAITGVLLATYEFARTWSWLRIVGVFMRGFLPAVGLLAAYFVWNRMHNAWSSSEFVPTEFVQKILNVSERGATPLSPVANLISLALLALVGGLTLGKVLDRRSTPGDLPPASEHPAGFFPWVAVWCCAAAFYLIMPANLNGWHKADVHVLPMAFLFFLTLPPAITSRRFQMAFFACTSLAVLIGLIPITQELLRQSAVVEEYLAGTGAVPRKTKLLSLMQKEDDTQGRSLSDGFNPLQWADSYYAMSSGGGVGRGLLANNTLYPVWFKDYEEKGKRQFPEVDMSQPTDEQLQLAAETYGSVILWNSTPELRTRFEAYGFATAFDRGRLLVLNRRDEVLTDHSRPAP